MVRITLNLDDVGNSFTLIEPGRYPARVVGIEEKESSTGNPMLVWSWELEGGDYSGQEIKSFTSLQDHALFGLKQHLEAFGVSGEVDLDTDKLIGKTAVLTITKTKTRSKNTGEEIEVNRINLVSPMAAKRAAATALPAADSPARARRGATSLPL
jgi:hypothetical protein